LTKVQNLSNSIFQPEGNCSSVRVVSCPAFSETHSAVGWW